MTEKVLVFGASNQIGHYLLPQLSAARVSVLAVTRTPIDTQINDTHITWLQADIQKNGQVTTESIATVFYLAPLPLLPNIIPDLVKLNVKRIIAFSSTSSLTKINSSNLADKFTAEKFQQAEKDLIAACESNQIAWTILRPTIIYSETKDKSIRLMASFIKKFRFFPLIGRAEGLRQPVHAADLADACMKVWHAKSTYNQSYNLSGGEVLTYKQMVIKIFHALEKKPKFLIIPASFLRLALRIIRLIPKYRFLNPEMANRMSHHHYFEHQKACQDFNYAPRLFLPETRNAIK